MRATSQGSRVRCNFLQGDEGPRHRWWLMISVQDRCAPLAWGTGRLQMVVTVGQVRPAPSVPQPSEQGEAMARDLCHSRPGSP